MTKMPDDADGNPIPCLGLRDGGAHHVAFTTSAAGRNTTAFNAGTKSVFLCATEACYIRFGNDETIATAADHYLPANTYFAFTVSGHKSAADTHISALGVSGNGTLHISETI